MVSYLRRFASRSWVSYYSALDIKNENFSRIYYVFEADHQNGKISNKGIISASEKGNIVLIGSKVSNYGDINLRNGSVALITGKKFA